MIEGLNSQSSQTMKSSDWSFTFWQWVRSGDGWGLRPYITLYDGMVEIESHDPLHRG